MVYLGSQDGSGLRGPGLPGSIATESPEDLGVPGAQGPQCPKMTPLAFSNKKKVELFTKIP